LDVSHFKNKIRITLILTNNKTKKQSP